MDTGLQGGEAGYPRSCIGTLGHLVAANTEVEKNAPIDAHITHAGHRR
ncbi:hypothetical protein OO184_01490 [Photorhabdus sp. APURE]|nr:hypothetical protein [Photorhabdus aballayi]MCW7546653.1 hypothetical protein [Photorhabdus aballayi]